MVKVIISEKLPRILKAKAKLERTLKVKISNRGREITIDGKPEDEYIAEKVIDAINFGFPFSDALTIRTQDAMFEVLNIKDYTKKKDLASIRARIIGTKGKALSTLSHLTKCSFEIKDNEVAIVGPPECMYNAETAVKSIIQGTKHSNVYAHLEKNQVKEPSDLDLKED